MPNINEAFPSKYLKASDLRGTEPVVTMDHVAFEPVGQDKEMKAVLYFQGKDKGLVLNKTNANKITQLMQSAVTEEWQGRKIRLFATETNFGADVVECIRIKAAPTTGNASRPPQPVAPPPPPVSEAFVGPDELSDSDIPF
jgi:hypothetical protein